MYEAHRATRRATGPRRVAATSSGGEEDGHMIRDAMPEDHAALRSIFRRSSLSNAGDRPATPSRRVWHQPTGSRVSGARRITADAVIAGFATLVIIAARAELTTCSSTLASCDAALGERWSVMPHVWPAVRMFITAVTASLPPRSARGWPRRLRDGQDAARRWTQLRLPLPAAHSDRRRFAREASVVGAGRPTESRSADGRQSRAARHRPRLSGTPSREPAPVEKHVVGDQARCVTLPTSAIKESRCRTSAMWTLPPSTTQSFRRSWSAPACTARPSRKPGDPLAPPRGDEGFQ